MRPELTMRSEKRNGRFPSHILVLAGAACSVINRLGHRSEEVPWVAYDEPGLSVRALRLPDPDRMLLDVWDHPDHHVMSVCWEAKSGKETVNHYVRGEWIYQLHARAWSA